MATVCFLLLGADYSNGSLKCYEDAVMFYGEGDSCFLSVGTAVPASPLPGQGSYTLYPNPASNYIQLHADFLPPYQPVDFALYDINGRLQYQKTQSIYRNYLGGFAAHLRVVLFLLFFVLTQKKEAKKKSSLDFAFAKMLHYRRA
jgi:hypothetical protein